MLSKIHMLILGIIVEVPVNPYEIIKILEKLRVKDWFPIADSSVYATIRALGNKSFITGTPVKEGNMPEKTVYSATENGRLALCESILGYLSSSEYDIQGLDLAIMLICHIDRDIAQAVLEKRLRLGKGLAGIGKQIQFMEAGGRVPAIGLLAVKHNRSVIEAEIKTIEELLAVIKADKDWNHFIGRDIKVSLGGVRMRKRVPETDRGIQGETNVELFDKFRRRMRDQGHIQVENIFEAGIDSGSILEIGPGPGYFGLEWLKKAKNARLTGIEISPDMLKLEAKNAAEYGLTEKTEYVLGNAMDMPFADGSFDAVISNGSLHEWQDPVRVFSELYRVLKPGGSFCVIDLCRETNPIIAGLIAATVKPKEAKAGFISSLNAAYTVEEAAKLLKSAGISKFKVEKHSIALGIIGEK